MTVVIWVCAAMLSLSAVLVLIRMAAGPTMLNRVVAMDVLIAVVVAGLGLEAALNRHATTLPILVVLSLVGFVGSVSVARFAAHDDKGEGS
ncbi:monovalent cation/H+ antiporter complex subunit F [Jiangella mangrovi]|uniref:Multicomponent Na+:H+ antiporter subunit F n=1 Tax=Jiangella mangrovi TaxID=1524084 RepID=A0A7W9LMM0_9ACTN|nr:monovalent cation/H+ antiporter complex subunit F [Jiangella mangrovi]MBB5789418.1 multicomponent Na+:H+ antiporter subunit F [Jiangella mangrovi]